MNGLPLNLKERSDFQNQAKEEKGKGKLYKNITLMSLRMCRPTSSLEGTPKRALKSSVVKASCALVSARLASFQTLDNRESAFPFPLSATHGFFMCGVISSTEVAGEAVLVALGMEVAG